MPAKGSTFPCLQANCWVPVAICIRGVFRRMVPGFALAEDPVHFQQGSSGPAGMADDAEVPRTTGTIGGVWVDVSSTFAFGRK